MTPRFVSSVLIAAGTLAAQSLYTAAPAGVETRWASPENPDGARAAGGQTKEGRKGRPEVPVKAGETLTLIEVKAGSGTVRRIWITIDDRKPEMLRALRLRMYWDGAAKPAVDVPLGDFFGHNLGQMVTFQSALFSSPEGRSFNTVLPMPFRKGMKLTLTNEGAAGLRSLYYDVDYTIGDKHPLDALYFHAYFHRENPTTLKQDFEILPKVAGRGRYLGANIGVIASKQHGKDWWGEGEVKAYLDGDTKLPTLAGTGTEDYIGTGWGQGSYSHLYQGCTFADKDGMRYGFYRLHVTDPVYFHKEARITIQQIGYAAKLPSGKAGLFERQDDWSAVAYFYLDKPTSALPDLAPLAAR